MNSFVSLFSTGLGMVGDWLEGRRRIQEARVESEIAIQQARVTADIDWDRIHAHASQTSWKDEFWTIVFAIPAILAFIPPFIPTVTAGFAALEEMPMYYRAALGTLVAASVGRQSLVQLFTQRTQTNGS